MDEATRLATLERLGAEISPEERSRLQEKAARAGALKLREEKALTELREVRRERAEHLGRNARPHLRVIDGALSRERTKCEVVASDGSVLCELHPTSWKHEGSANKQGKVTLTFLADEVELSTLGAL
jgi:hypothetical protein